MSICSRAATSLSEGTRCSSLSSSAYARSTARALVRTERGIQSMARSSSMIAPRMRELAYVSNFTERPGSYFSIASISPNMP